MTTRVVRESIPERNLRAEMHNSKSSEGDSGRQYPDRRCHVHRPEVRLTELSEATKAKVRKTPGGIFLLGVSLLERSITWAIS